MYLFEVQLWGSSEKVLYKPLSESSKRVQLCRLCEASSTGDNLQDRII